MSILDIIVKDKEAEIAERLTDVGPDDLRRSETDTRMPKDFCAALQGKSLAVIAEIKKASPSKGVIRPDFDPLTIARSYAKAGANCLSVLTEEKYFQGSPDYLKAIHREVDIPILRKDFIVDERQIRESYNLGADAILLIVSILSDDKLSYLMNLAADFGLTALIEVHSEQELSRALALECPLIGINNRNLDTFETDVCHSVELRKKIPSSTTCISESGIKTVKDCRLLKNAGFDAILVGETLMRQPDPGAHISVLLGDTA